MSDIKQTTDQPPESPENTVETAPTTQTSVAKSAGIVSIAVMFSRVLVVWCLLVWSEGWVGKSEF